MKNIIALLVTCFLVFPNTGHSQTKRSLKPSDIYRLKSVNDPQVSPEGTWIAYVLTTVDSVKDKRISDLWMVSWDGKQSVQLTHTPDGESTPRWSPDGKYLSFLSSRTGLNRSQIWLMDRRGGEAMKLTDIKGDINSYEWAPDGKKIALVIRELERPDSLKDKTKNPWVIDRVQFKQDVEGYLQRIHQHLYVFDVEKKKLDTLTRGDFNESSPAWSPDGTKIAFVSNRTADPDKNDNTDLYLVDAKPGSSIKQLTTWQGSDEFPQWSPDGKWIAYLQSTATDNFLMYDQNILATISSNGGNPKLLTQSLDRPVGIPHWSTDGGSLTAIISDDREEYLAEINAVSGAVKKVIGGKQVFSSLRRNTKGGWVALVSEPNLPYEIHSVENGTARRVTTHHNDFLSSLMLGKVEGFTSRGKDGTLVSNLLFLPPGVQTARNLPTLFIIHGGPVGQDAWGFDMTRQMYAAAGYAVVAVNYRGSSGRGLAFCKAIYADWGNKEVVDILGAADHLIKEGIADPGNLGIGGWSYGGILTNYSIATDPGRFKAAVSGAGSALQLSLYGVDQYIRQFENELGSPWKNLDKYLKLSYPFLKADKIKTPTLFMTGEKDFNVPAVGSEQMYQALRTQGIPTKLVVYPGQYHGISVPSYQKDRYERYIGWFGQYLNNPSPVKINTEIKK